MSRLKFKRRQTPLASLPSPSYSLPFPSPPLLSLPLPPRGLENALSSQSRVWGEAPAAEQFGAYLSQKEWPG